MASSHSTELTPVASAPARGSARRDAILVAAQQQFGRYGYRGVTLREVAREANVSLTLVDHHFGSKIMLFEAVARQWHAVVDDACAGLRALAEPQATRPSIERLIETFFDSLQAIGSRPGVQDLWNLYMRSRYDEDESVARIARQIHEPIEKAFLSALAAHRPGLPAEQGLWAYQFVRGALLERAAADAPGAMPPGTVVVPREQLRRWLGAFLGAGLSAVMQAP